MVSISIKLWHTVGQLSLTFLDYSQSKSSCLFIYWPNQKWHLTNGRCVEFLVMMVGRKGSHTGYGNSPTSKGDGIFHLSNWVQSQAIQSYQRFSLTWLFWELHFYETSMVKEKNVEYTKREREREREMLARKGNYRSLQAVLSSQQLSIHFGHQSIYFFHLVRSSFSISESC